MTPGAAKPLTPDRYERMLAWAAVALFALVTVAIVRGAAQWHAVPPVIWAHFASVMLALALTPVQLLRPRGDAMHRVLGWIWAVLLFGTAWASFAIREVNHGSLSLIHLLSAVTIVFVPVLVFAARSHRVARHRRSARGLVTGALLVAGYFTLLPSRMLGHWLWG